MQRCVRNKAFWPTEGKCYRIADYRILKHKLVDLAKKKIHLTGSLFDAVLTGCTNVGSSTCGFQTVSACPAQRPVFKFNITLSCIGVFFYISRHNS